MLSLDDLKFLQTSASVSTAISNRVEYYNKKEILKKWTEYVGEIILSEKIHKNMERLEISKFEIVSVLPTAKLSGSSRG